MSVLFLGILGFHPVFFNRFDRYFLYIALSVMGLSNVFIYVNVDGMSPVARVIIDIMGLA